VPAAGPYYVVIARDKWFTHGVDVVSTVVPAYAPQLTGKEALDDEAIESYWAVVPSTRTVKSSVSLARGLAARARQVLDTSTPIPPINGSTSNQPTLRWSPAGGAPNYALQATEDPTTPVSGSAIESSVSMRRPWPLTSTSLGPANNGTLFLRVAALDSRDNVGPLAEGRFGSLRPHRPLHRREGQEEDGARRRGPRIAVPSTHKVRQEEETKVQARPEGRLMLAGRVR
jgi:hypothetical protein